MQTFVASRQSPTTVTNSPLKDRDRIKFENVQTKQVLSDLTLPKAECALQNSVTQEKSVYSKWPQHEQKMKNKFS